MEPLSVKKYIETKARNLPIHRCLVNKDWKESRMANVVIMRRHVNGNITAGIYLVDLLCLGIKDTTYCFNIAEDDLMDNFYSYAKDTFKEINYDLAHNIVYAGHDFAMEFDIKPHKDFATTRFILEEGDEKIPIIEVMVGDDDGKPHLLVNTANRYHEVLAKLKKNAGKGNYNYTVISDEEMDDFDDEDFDDEDTDDSDDEDFDDDDMDDEFDLSLDEIETGGLNCVNVQSVMTEDLLDLKSVQRRTSIEQVIIQTELSTRLLPPEILELTDEEEFEWQNEFEEMNEILLFPNNVTQAQNDDYQKAWSDIITLEFESPGKNKKEIKNNEKQIIAILNKNSSNPLLVATVYENSVLFYSDELVGIAKSHADKLHARFPIVQLTLALGALINDTPDLRFEKIYHEKGIRTALPGYDLYYRHEIIYFWLIKIWVSIEKNNLKEAVQYYILVSQFDLIVSYMLLVLNKLNEALLDYYKTLDLKEHSENKKDPPTTGKIIPFR